MLLNDALAYFERFVAAIGTPGRKGAAFDRALIGVLAVTALMATDGGLSAEEGDIAIQGVIWVVGAFTTTNVGEHFARRGAASPAPETAPHTAAPMMAQDGVSGMWHGPM